MGDYGFKGASKGYDVRDAQDYLLSFSSSWPLLKIGDTATATLPISHNLGYPPFHIITTPSGQVDQNAGISDNFGVDSTVLARSSGAAAVRYFICRLSLTDAYTAPIISTSNTVQVIDSDRGFKLAKPGKDAFSTDMRDFAVHSGTRSLMVQKVDNGLVAAGGGLGWDRTVPHGLSYIPEAFAFILPGTNILSLATNRYCIIPPPIGVSGFYYTVDSSNVYVTVDPFYFSSFPRIAVVVLKNPLAKDAVNMSYP